MGNLEQDMVEHYRVAQFIVERAQVLGKHKLFLSYDQISDKGAISYEVDGEQKPFFNQEGDMADHVRVAIAWFKKYAGLDCNNQTDNLESQFSVRGILSSGYCQKVVVDTMVDDDLELMGIRLLDVEENRGNSLYKF